MKDGEPHGVGSREYEDDRVYTGDWVEGKRHGQGILKWTNGNTYEGPWFEDVQHGEGKFTTAKNGKVKIGVWE